MAGIGSGGGRLTRPAPLAWTAALLLLGLFALDAWAALSGASDRVDHFALMWLRDPGDARSLIVPRWTLQGAILFTDIGGAAIRAPLAVAGAIGLYVSGRRREAIAFTLAVASAAIALPLLKVLFGRARPDAVWQLVTENKASFPSGHALGAAVTFPLLGLFTGRGWALWAGVALALAIGLSRVFLGVHWLSDVAGGWLLGAAWICATLAVMGGRGRGN
ncbi:phosphatase PAP2 family protein [Sphingomonas sp. AP4-R1]|uniref:phosphatase PAP2 family protein n=1 Tax=Sphingomonas sp. AP4-R1 TaxID=2735134 RepID=UPI0014932977|nr:phosphatase PAP2 family protein [Sphingomonas sp. AP4-R1]QJU57503.1 phosphatase PAP2 family protein [Sphingomonas sp. AP4-R1]